MTTPPKNLYRHHRNRAAERNDEFSTMAKAAENLNISGKALSNWELGINHPDEDMIVYMADQYDEPGLLTEYCSSVCPIGAARGFDGIVGLDLAIAGIEIICELKKANEMSLDLLDVIRDGKITDLEELTAISEVVDWVKRLARTTEEIEANLFINT